MTLARRIIPCLDVDGGRAVALEEVEYIVYVDKPGPVEVRIERHGYDTVWLNPANGETVKLKVARNGSTKDLSVKLGELPLSKEEARNKPEGASNDALEGVSVETLDAEIAAQLQSAQARESRLSVLRK